MTERAPGTRRVRVEIGGLVQGVGFRPFLHRQAAQRGLSGFARNTPDGVLFELEGPAAQVEDCLRAVRGEAPPLAVEESFTVRELAPRGGDGGFSILESEQGSGAALALPDLGPCPACLRELRDPADRRYRYPFLNCTDCGPRYSILRRLPYDRANTSMAPFPMCGGCAREYADIRTRRYHAQPDCCPACGPRAFCLSPQGEELPGDPIARAQRELAAGRIVAVKGVGGFHLACDARSEAAVRRLRARKHRPEKPLAVLCADAEEARAFCRVGEAERALLESPRRPIVLLDKLDPAAFPALSANDRLGVMLPGTPLHVLLTDGTAGGPRSVVCTSANVPGCPVILENGEALQALANVADCFLVHNREIVNRCDDSLVLPWRGGAVFLRRSRGYAPQPVELPFSAEGVWAFGAEQKASFALGGGRRAFLSPHIGDLKNAETLEHYRASHAAYTRLFPLTPRRLVCDLHPDYLSTREAEEMARKTGLPLLRVQHHWAHFASCLADNGVPAQDGPFFGLVWDGTGLGPDGTVWGCEFLRGGYGGWERIGSLRPILLPGGDVCALETGRTALSLAQASCGVPDALFADRPERAPLLQLLAHGGRSPACASASSAGRLFDGVYSLITGRWRMDYEGQAPVLLEAMARGAGTRAYPLSFYEEAGVRRFDWRPLVSSILADLAAGVPHGAIARGFLDALCGMAEDQCRTLNAGRLPAALSGGVFCNRYLLESISRRLERTGCRVLTHRRVSPGDEGLCLGQLAIAAAQAAEKEE